MFPEESEYIICLKQEGKKTVTLSVYALAEDMRGRCPIVGSTDSHNSIAELSDGALICSTFVFAKENEREALICVWSSIQDACWMNLHLCTTNCAMKTDG